MKIIVLVIALASTLALGGCKAEKSPDPSAYQERRTDDGAKF